MNTHSGYSFGFSFQSERPGQTVQVAIGRNDPCPCGSGRKVKKCHLGPTPPEELRSSDSRLWPLLVALNTNALDYLAEILPAFAAEGFQKANAATRCQNLAVAFYACVAFRSGSAILTLMRADQGEEALGLRRELDDARMSLAYYQQFADEAVKLIGSRISNLLSFEQRLNDAGLMHPDPRRRALLERAARAEVQLNPTIITTKKGGHWTEPSMRDMLVKLHDAWSNDPNARHVGELVDTMLPEEKRGLATARAGSQHAAGGTIPSQWLHSTFILSDRYIEWGPTPRLRPLSNSIGESPNALLEVVADSLLAVTNGISRRIDSSDSPRMRAFGFALNWFQQVLAADRPQ
jgi:SEC-C motif